MKDVKLNLQTHLPDDLSLDDFAATLWRNLDIGVALVDSDGNWMYVNPRLCEIIGYTWQELKDMSFQDITMDDDLYYDLNLVDAIKKDNIEHYTLYKRYKHKLGHEVPIRLKVIPLGKERGNATLFLSQITHIHKQESDESDLNTALIKEIHSMNAKSTSFSIVCVIMLAIVLVLELILLG